MQFFQSQVYSLHNGLVWNDNRVDPDNQVDNVYKETSRDVQTFLLLLASPRMNEAPVVLPRLYSSLLTLRVASLSILPRR